MKRKQYRSQRKRHTVSDGWLPIDSRIIPDIFSFTYVRGWAALFLKVEMTLAVLVVIGTVLLLVFRLISY